MCEIKSLDDVQDNIVGWRDKEKVRSYLHGIVDFMVDNACSLTSEKKGIYSSSVDLTTDSYVGVEIKAVFHQDWVFDSNKGFVCLGLKDGDIFD